MSTERKIITTGNHPWDLSFNDNMAEMEKRCPICKASDKIVGDLCKKCGYTTNDDEGVQMERNWAIKIITDLCARKWYGKLTISFENGNIKFIKKEETLKP